MSQPAPPVDLSVLPELTGCEIEMLGEFLLDFQQIAATAASDLQQALDNGQTAQLTQTAHKVKSSARYIGAIELGQRSEALEHCAQQGNTRGCVGLVEQWLAEWRRVDEFITLHLTENPA